MPCWSILALGCQLRLPIKIVPKPGHDRGALYLGRRFDSRIPVACNPMTWESTSHGRSQEFRASRTLDHRRHGSIVGRTVQRARWPQEETNTTSCQLLIQSPFPRCYASLCQRSQAPVAFACLFRKPHLQNSCARPRGWSRPDVESLSLLCLPALARRPRSPRMLDGPVLRAGGVLHRSACS